ncbi:hypothetical protein HDU85_005048 [Gaertneriomyces sp. JEL0708]|nr:hypothetical protein HDU85_005048 [Gaertneriomyces sp. JEL0708]
MMSSANPFAIDDTNDNPFADPNASSGFQAVDYNTGSNAKTYPPIGSDSAGISAREEALRKREQELEAREATLRREQAQMRQQGFNPPNWPKFYPLFYHNIDEEITDPGANATMHKIYRLWLGTALLLVWNMIACLVLLISHPNNMPNIATDFGVSLMYMFVITAGSLYMWYRPVYIAFQRNAGLYFYIFLLFEGIHVAIAGYMCVGIPQSGSAGFINMLAALTDGKLVAGIFSAIAFAGWILNTLWSLWMWKAVHGHKSAGGHTLQNARNEAVGIGLGSGAGAAAANTYIRSESGNFQV